MYYNDKETWSRDVCLFPCTILPEYTL